MIRTLIVLFAISVVPAVTHADTQMNKRGKPPKVQWKPGEFVVKLKTAGTEMSKRELRRQLRASKLRYLTRDRRVVQIRTKVSRIAEAKTFIRSLNRKSIVALAEPNFLYKWVGAPNDPQFSKLWGLHNTSKPGVDVGAMRAWEITTGKRDVVVAVIDTGVDYTIKDLKPNMWVNVKEAEGTEGKDDDGNGYVDDVYGYDFANNDGDPMDGHGHGSHVAGTLGAMGDNDKDIVGVNWRTRIMAVKFLTDSGSGTLANAIRAIDYATENGAHVMNNSWGGGGYSKLLEDAIKRSHEKNALFVAAAGNHSVDIDKRPFYPAAYQVPNVLAVAAIQSNGAKASFSCWGKKTVGLGAPGVNILSTTPDGLKAWQGTSMASPHAAGVGALVMSRFPEVRGAELRDRLIKTAHPLSSMEGKTISGGIVNAYRALKNISR